MSRFFKGMGSVLLALFLALAWTWTDVLKDKQYINTDQRVLILVVLTIVLALQQIYLVLPKPIDRGTIEARRTITESFLRGFLNKYYEYLKSVSPAQALPVVRVNIMLQTKRFRGIFGSHLRIYYSACPPGFVYSDDERALRWKKKEGTCGWAWAEGVYSIYDSDDPQLRIPINRLNNRQTGVVANIKSAFSIPIWHNNKVVGTLNLDSKQNSGDTKFIETDVYTLAIACAQALAAQCPVDGVEM